MSSGTNSLGRRAWSTRSLAACVTTAPPSESAATHCAHRRIDRSPGDLPLIGIGRSQFQIVPEIQSRVRVTSRERKWVNSGWHRSFRAPPPRRVAGVGRSSPSADYPTGCRSRRCAAGPIAWPNPHGELRTHRRSAYSRNQLRLENSLEPAALRNSQLGRQSLRRCLPLHRGTSLNRIRASAMLRIGLACVVFLNACKT